MKHKKIFLSFSVLIGIICISRLYMIYVQKETRENVYAIQPGTKEWDALGTVQNKKEACRIPDDILKDMTDEELIQAILDYPFLVDIFASFDYSKSVKSVSKDCDALKELLARDTVKDSLVFFLEKRADNALKSISGKEEMENEAIMAIMAYNEKICTALDDEEAGLITNTSNIIEFKKDEISGSRMAYIYTPKGSQVGYITYTCSHDASDYHSAIDQYFVNTYGVTLISPGTCHYNCHSYAWYSTSTSNSFWIPNPMIYMTDGSYSQIMSGMNSISVLALNGDRVFYGTAAEVESSHSARLVSNPTGFVLGNRIVRSKWGWAGVFEHTVSNVPSDYLDDQSNVSVWR